MRGGARCVTVLSVAPDAPGAGRLARDAAFNAEIARAWVRHKVEEVGNLQRILPAIHLAMRDAENTSGSMRSRVQQQG